MIYRRPLLVVLFTWGDPFAFKNASDAEMRLENRNGRDPEQGPPPEPGDSYLFVCTIAGIIIGGAAGFFVAVQAVGSEMLFIGLIAGCVVGGIIGLNIGTRLKKRRRARYAGLSREEEKGPIIK